MPARGYEDPGNEVGLAVLSQGADQMERGLWGQEWHLILL